MTDELAAADRGGLTQVKLRLWRDQVQRIDRLALMTSLSRPAVVRQLIDLGADLFEQQFLNNSNAPNGAGS